MTKTLTHDEELTLIKDRDTKRSLDRLVLSNLGLVHKIVGKFPLKNAACSYEDLFQEGVAGLIHAIQKFEAERGYRLSTYSYRWIQAYITRYYQNHGRVIRVPVHMSTAQMTIRKETERLTRDLGRTPLESEVEAVCDKHKAVSQAMMPVSSLNTLISEDGELEDVCGVDNTEEVDTELTCEILLDRLRSQVSARDFEIFVKRCGLLGETPHTLGELASQTDVTRARIHQVERKCYRLLREMVS